MRFRLAVVMGLIGLVAGCVPTAEGETETLQGVWVDARGGKAGSVVTVKGSVLIFQRASGKTERMTFRLDPSHRLRQIDLTIETGEVLVGIYKLERETWTLCFRPGKDRPGAFTVREGTLMVLRRRT